LVHISDIHYRGNESYLNCIVDRINNLSPDFVCFTGDLVDEKHDLKETLNILQKIRYPVFGVPGNHEYWSGVSFDEISQALKNTGGAWLMDQQVSFGNPKIEIIGMSGENYKSLSDDLSGGKRLLLTHYPSLVDEISPDKFDLILAGHSHGGQVRFPFAGALTVPYGTDKYDRGLYKTNAGTLYVNPGIGTYGIHIRFLCRPEITVIEF
jgi:predicted MPP superfamily phosphohydrolase